MANPFDESFIASIPAASDIDTRHLPSLKKYVPHHLTLLSRWYEEEVVRSSTDKDLFQRLRNIDDSEAFLGAYWELVLLRYLRQSSHKVNFHHKNGEGVPEFFWPDLQYYGDVISVSDPSYIESDERQFRAVVHHLEQHPPPFHVILKTSELYGKRLDIPKIVDSIRSINPIFENDEREQHSVTDGNAQLVLDVYPLKDREPHVSRFLGELDGNAIAKRLEGRLYEKKKYPAPLIIFACPGQGFWALELDVVERALYGRQVIVFPLQEGSAKTYSDRRANGFFYNKRKDGLPANSGVSAVVWVGRSSKDISRGIGMVMRVFHNPFAKTRLPLQFFGDIPQYYVADETPSKIQMKLINDERGTVEVL